MDATLEHAGGKVLLCWWEYGSLACQFEPDLVSAVAAGVDKDDHGECSYWWVAGVDPAVLTAAVRVRRAELDQITIEADRQAEMVEWRVVQFLVRPPGSDNRFSVWWKVAAVDAGRTVDELRAAGGGDVSDITVEPWA
jgi:hypothetical protein